MESGKLRSKLMVYPFGYGGYDPTRQLQLSKLNMTGTELSGTDKGDGVT